MKRSTLLLLVIGGLLIGSVVFVYSGAFNVAADDPHWTLTARVLETARERSIAMRARGIQSPALDDAALLASGAGHYSAMCTGCHLAPGMDDSEASLGLYPRPPNLAERAPDRTPEQTFWVIKHGLKMTGMPAWGLTHDDRSIWGLVAFLQRLPDLSANEYQELVAQGSGHEPGEGDHAHATNTAEKPAKESDHDQAGHSHGEQANKGAAQPGAPLGAGTVEPVAVVDRFFSALAAGDTQSASALLDPTVLIFESGGAERSRDEYASHHLIEDAKFLESATHKLVSRTGDAHGDLAWVATEQRLSAAGEKPVDVTTTETMVLRKTQSGWRIVHIHWSSRAMRPAPART